MIELDLFNWIFGVLTGIFLFRIFTICQFNKNEFNLRHKIEHLKGDVRDLKIELETEKDKVKREEETIDDLRRDKKVLEEVIDSLGYTIEGNGYYMELTKKKE